MQIFQLLAVLALHCLGTASETEGSDQIFLEASDLKPLYGTNATLTCRGQGDRITWRHKKGNITSDGKHFHVEFPTVESEIESKLHVLNLRLADSGKYKCLLWSVDEKSVTKAVAIHVQSAPILRNTTGATITPGSEANLSCSVTSAPVPTVQWQFGDEILNGNARYKITEDFKPPLFLSTLSFPDAVHRDAGSYSCFFENSHGTASGISTLLMQDKPKVRWKNVQSINADEILLQWDIEDNHSPVVEAKIILSLNDNSKVFMIEDPSSMKQILSLENFEIKETDSKINAWLEVTNEIGSSNTSVIEVDLLKENPLYIPTLHLRGSSKDSLSVDWTEAPESKESFISYFELTISSGPEDTKVIKKNGNSTDHMFVGLQPGTSYDVTIKACMDVYEDKDKDCSDPSNPVSGDTMATPPKPVQDVFVDCVSNRTTGLNKLVVRWKPSTNETTKYKLDVLASANYIDEDLRRATYRDTQSTVIPGLINNHTFYDMKPNTNYTVRVYAGVAKYSLALSSNCEMPVWRPSKYNLRWWKFTSDSRTVLKMATPNVSQRNGTICCRRIIVVKLDSNRTILDLPSPQDVPLLSYEDVQSQEGSFGYVAEAFSSGVKSEYILIGDDKTVVNSTKECEQCLGESIRGSALTDLHKKSISLPYTQDLRKSTLLVPEDKPLSSDSNYTGYLILSVRDNDGVVYSSFSDYFNVIQPIEDPINLMSPPVNIHQGYVMYLLVGLIIMLFLITLCLGLLLCQYHYKKKVLMEDYNDENLTGSLGRIFQTLRRSHTLMSQPGFDIQPIPKKELVSEYLEKLKDSEMGFRKEFETLPEKFSDRTTKASEMSENCHKNRYPDIKAYDQTRVKLNEISGISGSHYINANYVMGYKERKKFICAQGPMEATVNDFWRMIVEQHSSLCIMLTNLEESGKMKCVKYWPEAGEPKQFGNITVRLVKEKPYADYVVRTLRAEWKVDIESKDKKESDALISNGSGTLKSVSSLCNSNYNSLSSESSHEETKLHEVQQYHYLMWKDFVAPEHPVGILSFLRRINEAYSPDMGPLLVHCSAGVGRTGTLVALDGLVTELEEENQASIYNFICDLRHQRNFLVQSLKQYVFIHRALMEFAQFGNTEKTASSLKESWKLHTQKAVGEQSELELEFERLGKVIEDRKAFTVANNESNKLKNRYDFILPYDNNCVILQPLANQLSATYINASLVQGFDLGENFIITQDPLTNTKSDFWRMVYEQGVNTIIMLSELGSGEDCCGKYWPDDEETHEYVKVKFTSSESYPKYTTRSFTITNVKNDNSLTVTQFQYVGWSGLMGEVPLVTQGVVEIISRVQAHVDNVLGSISHTIVHCSGGGDRSSLYVTLSNCLRQLRREGCVDIFQMARKVRSQRQHQIQLFAQYEFIYKALVEQIE